MINPDSRFLKILCIHIDNISEFLGIAVNQREPAALNLDHDSVTFFKQMRYLI